MPARTRLRKIRSFLWRGLLIASIIGILAIASILLVVEIRHNSTVNLPMPSGPYAIGRVLYDWTDYARPEIYSNQVGAHRELLVWVWYPAVRQAGAQTAPYLSPQWADALHPDLSGLLWQNDANVHIHAVENAPLSSALPAYPVLLFEPGLGNLPTDYTAMIEDIVSHGYIVAAITPSYSANVVVFPNGRTISSVPAAKLEDNANGTTSDQQSNQLTTVWAKDVSFTLDQLQKLDKSAGTPFSGHIDLNSVGMFGHSLGGAVALGACRSDNRCKASLDMDGSLLGTTGLAGLTRPAMIILHDSSSCSNLNCLDISGIHTVLSDVPPQERTIISVRGTEHFNFSDYALLDTPAPLLGGTGSINGQRGIHIAETYVEAFFATYLNHATSPLLQHPSPDFPEVRFFPYT